MNSDNISSAIMIGVTTLVGVLTISAIILFFNSSLNLVKNVGSGKDFGTAYRDGIESTLLLSNSGNYAKGTSVINLLSYYEQDINVVIYVQEIKYVEKNGRIQTTEVSIDSRDNNARKSAYNRALKYIMDNQDFTISVQDIDTDVGSKIITIRGV